MPLKPMPRQQIPFPFQLTNGIFVLIFFVVMLIYFAFGQSGKIAVQNDATETDRLYKAEHYPEAEKACRKALSDMDSKAYNINPANSFGSVTKGELTERLAMILCFEDKLQEALPYFQSSIDEHLKRLEYMRSRHATSDQREFYNSYTENINTARVIFNYGRVLSYLKRDEQAEKMFTSTWERMLNNCRNKHEQMQIEKNAIDRLVNFYEEENVPDAKEKLRSALAELELNKDDETRIKDYMVWLRRTCLYRQKHLTYHDGVFG